MKVHISKEVLPIAAVKSPHDNRLTKTANFCCDFFQNICNLRCVSLIGLGSAVASGILTAGLFITGCAINENYDNLGYKILLIALGTLFLTVCCLTIVWLPCKNGEYVTGQRIPYEDIGGGGGATL